MCLIKQIYCSGYFDHSGLTEEQAELKRLEHQRDKLEAAIQTLLDDRGRKLFEEYDECRTALTVLQGEMEFINGFRSGGRMAADMFLLP